MTTTILSINIMHHSFSKNHEDVSSGSEYYLAKQKSHCNKKNILYLLLNKSKAFEWKILL